MPHVGSKRAGSRGGRAAEGALERRLVRRGGAERLDHVDVAEEALQVRRVLGDAALLVGGEEGFDGGLARGERAG